MCPPPALQGNYPYPSSYILNGLGTLPAYPVRVACENLAHPKMKGLPLLSGLAAAASVYYNYTGAQTCVDFTKVGGPPSRRVSCPTQGPTSGAVAAAARPHRHMGAATSWQCLSSQK